MIVIPMEVIIMESLKVLIVEDHLLTAEKIQDYFDMVEDFKVIGIAEGETEALEILKREKPSIAIVDISLKEGNGITLIEKIFGRQHLDYKPCVVVVTQTQTQELHEKLYAAGVNYIFGKYEPQFSYYSIIKYLRSIYGDLPRP